MRKYVTESLTQWCMKTIWSCVLGNEADMTEHLESRKKALEGNESTVVNRGPTDENRIYSMCEPSTNWSYAL